MDLSNPEHGEKNSSFIWLYQAKIERIPDVDNLDYNVSFSAATFVSETLRVLSRDKSKVWNIAIL